MNQLNLLLMKLCKDHSNHGCHFVVLVVQYRALSKFLTFPTAREIWTNLKRFFWIDLCLKWMCTVMHKSHNEQRVIIYLFILKTFNLTLSSVASSLIPCLLGVRDYSRTFVFQISSKFLPNFFCNFKLFSIYLSL